MVNKSKGDMAYTLVDVDSVVNDEVIAATGRHQRRACRALSAGGINHVDDPLKQLRARIDTLDDELLQAVVRACRHRAGSGAHQEWRDDLPARTRSPDRAAPDATPIPVRFEDETVERLFREIMSACRALEQTLRIAYLGPAGTFSQAAVFTSTSAMKLPLCPKPISTPAFRSVETGRADFAVVPVENSTEGVISRTLDLIVTSPLKICGEVMLPIHQNLMRKRPLPASGAAEGSRAAAGIRRRTPCG